MKRVCAVSKKTLSPKNFAIILTKRIASPLFSIYDQSYDYSLLDVDFWRNLRLALSYAFDETDIRPSIWLDRRVTIGRTPFDETGPWISKEYRKHSRDTCNIKPLNKWWILVTFSWYQRFVYKNMRTPNNVFNGFSSYIGHWIRQYNI